MEFRMWVERVRASESNENWHYNIANRILKFMCVSLRTFREALVEMLCARVRP